MPFATLGRNLKGLVPVSDPCSVAGEDIPEISQDCILYTYHPILFQKDQEEFWALITREQSQYPDPGGCIRPHGSIN